MSLPRDVMPDPQEALRRSQEDPLVATAIGSAAAAGVVDCPDAELLGLYAERELAGGELARVRTHVDGCARCHAAVAAYARATVGAPDAGDRRSEASAGGFAAWFSGWRWLVPAASVAAIAVVAVWVNREPASQMAEVTRAVADAAAPSAATGTGAGMATGAIASADKFAQAAPSGLAGGVIVADRPAQLEAVTEAARRAEMDARFRQNTGARPDAAVAATASRELRRGRAEPERQAATPVATPAPVAPAAPAAVTVPAESAQVGALADATAKDEAPARKMAAAAGGNAVGAARDAGGAGAADLRAAFPRWRVQDGSLQFARDGRAWTRVTLPTTERVTGVTERPDGSVVATTASGARFVSTDIGATWRREM